MHCSYYSTLIDVGSSRTFEEQVNYSAHLIVVNVVVFFTLFFGVGDGRVHTPVEIHCIYFFYLFIFLRMLYSSLDAGLKTAVQKTIKFIFTTRFPREVNVKVRRMRQRSVWFCLYSLWLFFYSHFF